MDTNLFETAEAPGFHVIPRHPDVVITPGWTFLPLQPKTAAVQRIRLAPDELEVAREAVRELGRQGGFEAIGWWITRLSEPADIPERLGLEHLETLTALTLTSEPPPGGDLDVREVTTLDDYAAAQAIDATVHGWPIADRAALEEHWPRASRHFLQWLALQDGRPVGMARCAVSEHALIMIGGSVLPEARGRGVYRALVAARWRTAVERGIPALVTSANDQSGPILKRIGFQGLGDVEVWLDRL